MANEEKKKQNSAKSPRKKKLKEPEPMFLLKRGNEFYLLPASVLDSLAADEIYRLGIAAYIEQRRQLMQDALEGDHYINDIKVVDGLESSLRKLEEKFPDIFSQIGLMDISVFGSQKIGKC